MHTFLSYSIQNSRTWNKTVIYNLLLLAVAFSSFVMYLPLDAVFWDGFNNKTNLVDLSFSN